MGRRRKRRKVIRRVKKRIPSVFECPRCGIRGVTVEISREKGSVIVKCGGCGLMEEFENVDIYKPVDFYNMFVDDYYEGKLEQMTSKRVEQVEK